MRMFGQCGYEISSLQTSEFEFSLSPEDKKLFEQLLKLPGIAPSSMFDAYQYLIKAGRIV